MYEEFLERAKKAPQFKKQYEKSNLIKNAFDDDFVLSSPEAYVKTTSISSLFNELADRLGLGKSIIMKGPHRSGKTSAARFLTIGFNEDGGDNLAQYIHYDQNFWDWWESADLRNTQFLFLDGIFPIWNDLTKSSFDDLNSRSKFDEMMIIAIVDSIEYRWLSKKMNTVSPVIFGHEPSIIEFPRPSKPEIVKILKQRYIAIGEPNPFSNDLLENLGTYSFRLPGLALWITRHLLRSTQDVKQKTELTVKDLEKIDSIINLSPSLHIAKEKDDQITQERDQSGSSEPLDIAYLSTESPYFEQKIKQYKKITKSRLHILEEMLLLNHIHGTVKRTDLQERTGVIDSSLTYQCQNLIKEKLITYMKDGREVFYQLPTPTKEALELLFFD
jgi:hypothetical protein